MAKFQFLLLDAVSIIGLFELNLWERFIERCDVTVGKTVAEEAKYASQTTEDIRIDLEPDIRNGKIKVIDIDSSQFRTFNINYLTNCRYQIDKGEMELLAWLFSSKQPNKLCTSDGPVFQFLGYHNREEQSISLEEVLTSVGLSVSQLKIQYTKKFRETHIRRGKIGFAQNFNAKKQ